MKNLRQYMDALYLPAPEEYRKNSIGIYNEKIAEVKNLYKDGMFTERFILLQGVYRFLLSRFLLKQAELAKIDQEIENHEAGFSEIEAEEKDIYQKSDFMGLRYLYLRNHIHIERLEISQLKFLETLLDSFSKTQAIEARELLKSTYKNVIAFSEEILFQETELLSVLSGEENVLTGILVLGISAKASNEGRKVLLKLKNHLEPTLSMELNMPVRILVKFNERGWNH